MKRGHEWEMPGEERYLAPLSIALCPSGDCVNRDFCPFYLLSFLKRMAGKARPRKPRMPFSSLPAMLS